jgi:hypothetical protein
LIAVGDRVSRFCPVLGDWLIEIAGRGDIAAGGSQF